MSIDEKDNLKLIGKNQEDLKVISAYLQDSVVIVRDIVFLKKNRTFIKIVNRFSKQQFIESIAFIHSKLVSDNCFSSYVISDYIYSFNITFFCFSDN